MQPWDPSRIEELDWSFRLSSYHVCSSSRMLIHGWTRSLILDLGPGALSLDPMSVVTFDYDDDTDHDTDDDTDDDTGDTTNDTDDDTDDGGRGNMYANKVFWAGSISH